MSDENNLALTVFILCKNKLVKEYIVTASRKFNIGDETYIIKKDCTYPRCYHNMIQLVSYYTEGNPNPYNLREVEKNIGLNSTELNHAIEGDVNNIIVNCQRKDRTKHIFTLSAMILGIGILQFIIGLIFGG